jgi:hypothetical protein
LRLANCGWQIAAGNVSLIRACQAGFMWLLVALLLLLARPVAAQPANCSAAPPTGPMMALGIGLARRPGVPKGVSGEAYAILPTGPPAGTDCHDDPPKPFQDVLRGEPGDVLGGPPFPDLLRGPGHPHVKVEEVR